MHTYTAYTLGVEGTQICVMLGVQARLGWSSVLWGWAGVMGVGEEPNYFLNIADPLNTAFLPIMICAYI